MKYGNQLQSTPQMVNGVLYASNGIGLVEAFDPATGKTIWVQELAEHGEEALAGEASRGVDSEAKLIGFAYDYEQATRLRRPSRLLPPLAGEVITSLSR